MQLDYKRLSEKDCRHYDVLESLKLGVVIIYFVRLLGADSKTILQGRKELIS